MPSKSETLNALCDAQGHSPRLENRSIPTKANTEAHLCSKKKSRFQNKIFLPTFNRIPDNELTNCKTNLRNGRCLFESTLKFKYQWRHIFMRYTKVREKRTEPLRRLDIC